MAAMMVMQLIKDNRKVVDRMKKSHINTFVELLRDEKVTLKSI